MGRKSAKHKKKRFFCVKYNIKPDKKFDEFVELSKKKIGPGKMQEYTGPSLSNYLMVVGFLFTMILGFYYLKKNRHIISQKINSKKRMKVSEVTLLGQGDRALILNLDNKDYLFISGKNSGSLLTEIKKNNALKTNNLEKVFEKRIRTN